MAEAIFAFVLWAGFGPGIILLPAGALVIGVPILLAIDLWSNRNG